MAVEVFIWSIQATGQPTTKSKDTIRKAQFGDGYAQVSGSGLNDETLEFDYTFRGRPETGLEIYAFLRRHKTKSFLFAPPFGELALWRVQADSLQKVILGKKVMTVTATFEQAFAP
ncbi:phage tail protein [Trabulsiella odontotermitis]|uniref:phage tail protein n=1 Tax=Trabulsiella odontotermitis TaxID=379893 RepID=UPI0024B7BEC2|nr:phage tail protein [Trabulsiella odontotermitis]WHP32841.1 phage tail protein [Trabulsiella odontotermitis]